MLKELVMPHYAVIGFDPAPHNMAQRDLHRPDHSAYVLEHDEMIRLAAAMVDDQGNQCGSLYIFEAESEAQVASWVAAEPFCTNDVYSQLKIVQLGIAVNRLEPFDWRPPTAE
jgi:uncharacterized protein YciI